MASVKTVKMFDWQTILVALIILAALAYTSRRLVNRLRSLRLNKHSSNSSCATGCGNCGDDGEQINTASKRTVQISRLN